MKKYIGEDIKLVFISDTHGLHEELNEELSYLEGDLLIHSGDISNTGKLWEIDEFCSWFSSLKQFKNKIFIAGNHDFGFQDGGADITNILAKYPNITYLQNQEICLNGVTIYGSPYTPTFYNWAFMKDRGSDIGKVWEDIPQDVDILITHGPPFGIGDLTPGNINTGCLRLLDKVREVRPVIHVFGHIHHSNGLYKNDEFNTLFINASVVNEQYRVVNKPIVRYLDYNQIKMK